MHQKGTSILFLFLTITIALFSCVTQKKVATVKKEITTVDSQLQQYGSNLKQLESQSRSKQEQNEMDDTANARIQKFIANTNASIAALHAQNMIVVGNTAVNRADWEKLVRSLSLSRKSSKQIGEKIVFLTDLVNQNLVIKIDQDIIFEPGQYTVTPPMAEAIVRFFEPPAKEIDQFIKKYPDFPLSIVITAKGYADGTSISEGSVLYKDLKARLTLAGKEPDNKELNKELSRARAKEIITLFQKFAATQSANGSYLNNVLYVYEGKGETIPDPKIPDYRIDDPRRRVVLLFWSIFPE